jgi:hypothetical protein
MFCPCTSWKRTSKKYGKGIRKADIVTSFLVHLKDIVLQIQLGCTFGSTFIYFNVLYCEHLIV